MNNQRREIHLPYKFTPRIYQTPLLYAMEKEKKKRGMIVQHRRSGKDKLCLNYMIEESWLRVGLYAYFFPTYKQGRKVLWKGMDRDGFRFMDHIPEEIRANTNDTEMRIMLINGSIFQIFGTDDPDAFMGANPIGCVFSEYSLQVPMAWDLIRPILRENGGWALFNCCVAGDTLVLDQSGLRRIDSFSNNIQGFRDINYNIYGLDGFHNAEQFYNGGIKDVLKITTKSGYSLTCTKNHPIWNGMEWVNSENLTVGDLLPIQRGQQIWGNNTDISDYPKINMRYSSKSLNHIGGGKLSLRLSYLLGLLVAEGSWSDSGGITVTTKYDRDLNDTLTRFGFKRYDDVHYIYCSKQLVLFLDWFGMKRGAKNKCIPNKILQAPKKHIAAFLRGYFDGDGCATKKGGIQCDSISERLIDELQVLLLNFGITSKKYKYTVLPTKKVKSTSIVFRLEICGYNAWLFYDQIGFKLQRKNQRKSLLSKRKSEWYNDSVTIPREILNDFISGINEPDLKRHNNVTYNKLKRLLLKKKNDYIEKVVNDNFYYDEIISILPMRSAIYDFVIPKTHSFFSNGFISHNTPRGRNHAFKLAEMAKRNKNWFYQELTVNDTFRPDGRRVITDEMIQEDREEGMSEAMIQQEYYISWDAALDACFFGNSLQRHNETSDGVRGDLVVDANDKVQFVKNERGILEVWDHPYNRKAGWDKLEWKKRYSIGSDISEGLERDFSVAYVYDRVAQEFVARMRSNKVDAHLWADFLNRLSLYYDRSIIIPERNGVGITTCERLVALKANYYFNSMIAKAGAPMTRIVGWVETHESKAKICGDLRQYFTKTTGTVKDALLLMECSTFVIKENEKIEAEDGFQDDCPMAAALALQGSPLLFSGMVQTGQDELKEKNQEELMKKLDSVSKVAAKDYDEVFNRIQDENEYSTDWF